MRGLVRGLVRGRGVEVEVEEEDADMDGAEVCAKVMERSNGGRSSAGGASSIEAASSNCNPLLPPRSQRPP